MDRVDFFANLPPEIISHIISYLSGEDAIQCLYVSRLWDERIGTQDTFWKRKCVEFGIPHYLIEEHLSLEKCLPAVALFVAARRQRQAISSRKGVVSRLERRKGEYPVLSGTGRPRSMTYSMGIGYILEVVRGYQPAAADVFEQSSLLGPVPKSPRISLDLVLLGRIDNQKIEKVCEISPNIFNSVWRNILPDQQCVVTVSSNAKWEKHIIPPYPIQSSSQSLSVAYPVSYNLLSPRTVVNRKVVYSACSKCSMMVGPTQNGKATCLLTFVVLDQLGELMFFHRELDRCDLYNLRLVSSSSGNMTGNICNSHHLFFQSRHHVGVYSIKTVTTPSFRLDVTTVAQIGPVKNTIRNIIHSSDGKLLGIHHKEIFQIWVVASTGCRKVSEVKVARWHQIVALGHIYSILVFTSHSLTITVAVISTCTGETIWTYVQRPIRQRWCTVGEEPDLNFLTTIKDGWLSDVYTPCPPLVPFIVFENSVEAKKGNLAVDGLSFCEY